jgi:DNA polymerase/3'-5' exonuclease PolX
MKKRRVLKKGKIFVTREGEVVIHLADNIIKSIKPFCSRIQIVGSIRRKEKTPVDIDIALIPKNEKDKDKIGEILKKKGRFIQGGEKRATFRIRGIKVELY